MFFDELGAEGIAFGITFGWLIAGFAFYQKVGGRIRLLTWYAASVTLVYLISAAYGNRIGLGQYVAQLEPGDRVPWISTPIVISAVLLGCLGPSLYYRVKDRLKETKQTHFQFATRICLFSFSTSWFALFLHDTHTSIPMAVSRSTIETATVWCVGGSMALAGWASWLWDRAKKRHEDAKKIADSN